MKIRCLKCRDNKLYDEKYSKGEDEQQLNTTISQTEDAQLKIDDNSCFIPDLPSIMPIEHDEKWEEKIEKAQKVLYKNLAKYGITKEEWEENLKKYLQLRFREIENEICYPKLKPTDFLI